MMSRQQEEHVAELASINRRSEEEVAALKAKLEAAVKRAQEAEAQRLEQGENYKKQVSPSLQCTSWRKRTFSDIRADVENVWSLEGIARRTPRSPQFPPSQTTISGSFRGFQSERS